LYSNKFDTALTYTIFVKNKQSSSEFRQVGTA